MKLTSLLRLVDKLQLAGKIDNLEQVCGVLGCIVIMIVTIICDGGDCSGGEYSDIVGDLKNLLGNLLFHSVLQVLLNRETWRTCLVLVFGAKEHHSENLENLFKLLKDGKLGTQTSFSSNCSCAPLSQLSTV